MPSEALSKSESKVEEHRSGEAVPVTDGELLMLFIQHRSQEAFEQLVARHAALVWSACRQILHSREDAEDAFQATFLILAKRAGDIRASDSAAGWLYRVAHRTALHLWRQNRDRPTEPINGHDLADDEIDPLEHLQQQHVAKVLAEEMHALPERYREPLVLFHLEGLTQSEAADLLDLSPATIKGRLARGRRMLRSRLARRGVAMSVAVGFAAAAVKSAQAKELMTGIAAETPSTASDYISTTGSCAAVSPTVINLVQNGVSTVYFASLSKMAVGLLAITAIGIGVAIANDSPEPTKPTVPLLAVAQDSESTDAPNVDIRKRTSLPNEPGPPVADNASGTSGLRDSFGAAPPTRVRKPPETFDPFSNRDGALEETFPQPQPYPAAKRSLSVPINGVRVNLLDSQQSALLQQPTLQELQLEQKYWRTRISALQMKSAAIQENYKIVSMLVEQNQISKQELAKAKLQLAEAEMMAAEVYLARAKDWEVQRKLKQREQLERLSTGRQQLPTVPDNAERSYWFSPAPAPPIAPPLNRNDEVTNPAPPEPVNGDATIENLRLKLAELEQENAEMRAAMSNLQKEILKLRAGE